VTPLAGGNVLVGGDFTTAGGAEHPAFVRLSGSGALDAAFTSPADVHTVKSACVQGDDGSIWIGGSDSSYFRNPLATHFDENGLFDPTSQRAYQAAHAEGAVNVVLCATDGLSWGGGRFSTVDGRPFYGLAKYLSLDQQIFLPLILR
jgi:hypothetical protein